MSALGGKRTLRGLPSWSRIAAAMNQTAVDPHIPENLGEAMNRIGVITLEAVGDPDASVLLYAEVHDDMDQVFLRYMAPGEDKLRCSEQTADIADAVVSAWRISRNAGQRWRALVYRISERKMHVELLYDEHVDDELTFYEKELRLLARLYPGVEVVPADVPGSVALSLPRRRSFWRFWQ